MKSSLYLACFLCWLFKQFQAFAVEMNSRVPVKDCYDDKLGTFSFPVTISGISENASCFEHCNCNGTAISWQSNFNCEWCCCQNRVLHKEIAPDYIGYRIWGSITTILMVVIPLVLHIINRRKIKRIEKELDNTNIELEQYKIGQDNYRMESGL